MRLSLKHPARRSIERRPNEKVFFPFNETKVSFNETKVGSGHSLSPIIRSAVTVASLVCEPAASNQESRHTWAAATGDVHGYATRAADSGNDGGGSPAPGCITDSHGTRGACASGLRPRPAQVQQARFRSRGACVCPCVHPCPAPVVVPMRGAAPFPGSTRCRSRRTRSRQLQCASCL